LKEGTSIRVCRPRIRLGKEGTECMVLRIYNGVIERRKEKGLREEIFKTY